MATRAIKALNTAAGLSNYVVVVIGMPQEITTISKAFEECGFNQLETGFIHKEGTKQVKWQIV